MLNPLLREILFYRWHQRFLILVIAFVSTSLALFAPFLQKEFIDGFMGIDSKSFLAALTPVQLILSAFACLLISQALQQLAFYIGSREGFLLQKIFAQRLYQKTLKLKVDTLSSRPLGEIVQLYATDVPSCTVFLDQTIPAGASTLFPLILGPLAISYFFDVPLLPVLITMGLIISINCFLAFRQSRFFYSFKKLAGERIGLVNEWIQNIRIIRILGWTPLFENAIFEKREIETINRVRMVTNGQMMNAISSSITFVLNLVALMSLIYLSGRSITSGELMALLWIVGIFLTRPFRQMPWFFTFAFDGWTSLRRLEEYFNIENNQASQDTKVDLKEIQSPLPEKKMALSVRGLSLQVRQNTVLKNISFDLAEGEFVAVVGEVGSGKSMLLLSLLGETGAHFQKYFLRGENLLLKEDRDWKKSFSFVPQEGFIMSASLRENVAFLYDIGSELDPKILNSLEVSQFSLAKERVENGLETEIGERGVNLSGGQKQRVSIARVHFQDSSIILLDDCLSAVDIDTEAKLFDSLLEGEWKGRTKLLITHRLTVLPKVHRILFLENGQIEAQGTFEELLAHSEKFRDFTSSVQKNQSPNPEALL